MIKSIKLLLGKIYKLFVYQPPILYYNENEPNELYIVAQPEEFFKYGSKAFYINIVEKVSLNDYGIIVHTDEHISFNPPDKPSFLTKYIK